MNEMVTPVYGADPSGFENRIKSLEIRLVMMREELDKMLNDVTGVKSDTSEILALLTTTKDVYSFIKKYGGRVIVFGAGVMTAAGIGNPEVLKFISHFFG